jgi:endogenous inhibitor of DNA gyrase (YacG/DUF329 family)
MAERLVTCFDCQIARIEMGSPQTRWEPEVGPEADCTDPLATALANRFEDIKELIEKIGDIGDIGKKILLKLDMWETEDFARICPMLHIKCDECGKIMQKNTSILWRHSIAHGGELRPVCSEKCKNAEFALDKGQQKKQDN